MMCSDSSSISSSFACQPCSLFDGYRLYGPVINKFPYRVRTYEELIAITDAQADPGSSLAPDTQLNQKLNRIPNQVSPSSVTAYIWTGTASVLC